MQESSRVEGVGILVVVAMTLRQVGAREDFLPFANSLVTETGVLERLSRDVYDHRRIPKRLFDARLTVFR